MWRAMAVEGLFSGGAHMRASMRSNLLVAILGLFVSTSVMAGPLNGHPDALSPLPIHTGSTMFNNGGTLQGYVDYAVFAPGDFPYPPSSGYTPTAGQLTYAYQVFVTGQAPVSSFEMVLLDQANNIGWFETGVGGVTPVGTALTSMVSAKWTFPGIQQGDHSFGLAFSSPNIPQQLFATVVDTGQAGPVIPLPSPSNQSIPEPASLSLAAIGCLMLGMRRRSR
jgi:hypothetical protein